jgi:hypothetical protein
VYHPHVNLTGRPADETGMSPRHIAKRRFGSGTNDARIVATAIPIAHGALSFADATYRPSRERPVAREAKWD